MELISTLFRYFVICLIVLQDGTFVPLYHNKENVIMKRKFKQR